MNDRGFGNFSAQEVYTRPILRSTSNQLISIQTRNASLGGLKPCRLPLGHGSSHNIKSLQAGGEGTFSFLET